MEKQVKSTCYSEVKRWVIFFTFLILGSLIQNLSCSNSELWSWNHYIQCRLNLVAVQIPVRISLMDKLSLLFQNKYIK